MARKTQKRSRQSLKDESPVTAYPRKSLNSGKLKRLYSSMLRCRMLEERAQMLLEQGEFNRAYQMRIGSEAAEVGAMFDLQPKDCVSCGRRDVVAGFIRGVPLADVLAQLLTHPQAPGPNGASPPPPMESTAGIVAGPSTLAARMNVSAGVALAYKMQKKPNVVMVFSGDDATALSSWRESVAFAVARKLPVVHVVQDDLGDESVALRSHAMAKDSDSSIDAIPRLIVDGTDAVAVYRVAQEAIRRARQGHGPALIECKTCRWVGHSDVGPKPSHANTNHDPGSSDPLLSMEAYLKQRGLWSDAWKERLVRSFTKEFEAAISRTAGIGRRKLPARLAAKANTKSQL
jgi:TPP-dependent pyruvate/acetoin dehydrogenase alpha subunit